MHSNFRKLTALFLLLMLTVSLNAGCSGVKLPEEPAAIYGETEASAEEFMFYYCSGTNSYIKNNYLSMSTEGYNFNMAPSKQTSEHDGVSWNEFFISAALDSLMNLTSLISEADANGFEVPEAELNAEVERRYESVSDGAKSNNMSVKDFIHSYYGKGISVELFKEFTRRAIIAQAYANYCYNDAAVTQEEADAAYNDNSEMFTSVTFRLRAFFISGNDGVVTAEDARKNAYAFLEGITTPEQFEAAAQAMLPEDSADKDRDITLYNQFTLNKITSEEIKAWFKDPVRRYGDTAVFGSVDRYMAVMFISYAPIEYNVADIGVIKTSTEARAAEYKALFDATGKTDAEFVSVSADGKVYVNAQADTLTPAESAWAFDSSRKPGDTALIEEEEGWSLVWYKAKGATFREYKAENLARSARYSDYMASVQEKYSLTSRNDEVINAVIAAIEGK